MRERELKQNHEVGGIAKCRSLPMRERELKLVHDGKPVVTSLVAPHAGA